MEKDKLKVNDRVFSESWRNYGSFFIVDIVDETRIVIQNETIRAIVKPFDLTLVRKENES